MEGCDSSLILQGYNVAAGGGVCRSSVARGDCNFSCHVRHGRTQAPQGARGPVSLACFFAGFGAGPRSCAPPSQPIRGQSALPPLSNAYLKLHRNVRREVVRWGEVLRCGGDDDGVIVVVGGGLGVLLSHILSLPQPGSALLAKQSRIATPLPASERPGRNAATKTRPCTSTAAE